MLLNNSKTLKIFLINVEALSTKRGFNACVEYLKKNKLNFVTLDESTTIKNRSAKRTKNILGLSKLSHIKRILTGSPITKSPLDLYTQCAVFLFKSRIIRFCKLSLAFRNRYAEMTDIPVGLEGLLVYLNTTKKIEELRRKQTEVSILQQE